LTFRFSVIPAKAGIQRNQYVLDVGSVMPGLTRDRNNELELLRVHLFLDPGKKERPAEQGYKTVTLKA
jgi:hypothetical protein